MTDYVFLFDYDGVINPFPTKKFTERFNNDFPKSLKVLDFFNDGTYSKCKEGKFKLESEFPKYLIGTEFEGKIEKLLEYWHDGDNGTDKKLLKKINKLKQLGYKTYLGTNQANTRINYMLNTMNLGNYFDHIIASCNIKSKKPDELFFQKTYEIINQKEQKYNKNQIIFFDDKEKNIQSGKSFGFESHLYRSIEDLNNVLKNINIII